MARASESGRLSADALDTLAAAAATLDAKPLVPKPRLLAPPPTLPRLERGGLRCERGAMVGATMGKVARERGAAGAAPCATLDSL